MEIRYADRARVQDRRMAFPHELWRAVFFGKFWESLERHARTYSGEGMLTHMWVNVHTYKNVRIHALLYPYWALERIFMCMWICVFVRVCRIHRPKLAHHCFLESPFLFWWRCALESAYRSCLQQLRGNPTISFSFYDFCCCIVQWWIQQRKRKEECRKKGL